MSVEIFSIWGAQKGMLSSWRDGYQISAVLGRYGIWYTGSDSERLKMEFRRACLQALLHRLLPFVSPPPGRLSF